MPLVRIAMRRDKSSTYIAAVRDGIYAAMRESFDVPENDRFILVSQHDADEFDCDPRYLDITRSDDLIVVQIACRDSRSITQKQAFFRCLTERLAIDPGLRPDDVFVNLLETAKENWSFGNGIAQYA